MGRGEQREVRATVVKDALIASERKALTSERKSGNDRRRHAYPVNSQ